jgi:hypothetical protein
MPLRAGRVVGRQEAVDPALPGWFEARTQREAQVAALNIQKERFESRLERMYLDKLDGNLAEDEYIRMSNKFRSELSDIRCNLEKLQAPDEGRIDSKVRVLELAQSAASLYSAQVPEEKRKLLNLVCSNSTWASGELMANYNKPFDIIAVTNDEYKKEKATSPEKSDLIEIWRPRDDSNVRPLP